MLYKLKISGFRGLTKTVEFGKSTLVSGGNGLGKTTIIDAIRWCLVGVDGDDKTNNNLFNNRKATAGKETVEVECAFVDADGVETVFGRTATRKGDKVEYAYRYGEIEVSAKKYGETIEKMFLPVPQLKFVLNVRRWDTLDESVLRKALLGLYDESALICDEAYKEIKDKIEVAGIEDTKKQLRKEMRDAQKNLDAIQVEMNVVEQGIPEIIASDEAQKRLEEREAELKRLEESPSEMPAELREKIQEEAKAIAALEAEYEEARQQHHVNYAMRLQELKSTYSQATEDKRSLDRLRAERESEQAVIDNSRQRLTELRAEYDDLMKRVFEGACPCCGRPYEGVQRSEMEAEWRKKKDDMIAGIKTSAKRIKDNAEAAKARIAECDGRISEIKDCDPTAVLNEIRRMESEGETAFATTEQGKEMQARIDAAKAERTDVSGYDKERVNGIEALRNEIFDLKMRLADAERLRKERDEGLAKVAEIKERQAQVVKRVSVAERLLALTNRYEIALLQGLQDYLNDILNAGAVQAGEVKASAAQASAEQEGAAQEGYTESVSETRISLYYIDADGEVHSQCKIISNGVSETINNAQRSIIGLRLAEALIRKSGKDIPVLIDNVEAFDRKHRPTSEYQLILSKVDDEGDAIRVVKE